MLEHIQNLDRVLVDLERVGLTISIEKSQFYIRGLQIVSYVYNVQGRYPVSSKTVKINLQLDYYNLKECCSFIGLYGYYRIQVVGYAIIIAPIYNLFVKGTPFLQGRAQRDIIARLKIVIISVLVLISIRYNKPLLIIFIIVNISLEEQRGVIKQIDTEGYRYSIRFKSGVQSKAKRNYNTYKREYKGVIYLLKKFRYYLYRVHFILETDTKTLVTQLNRSILDLLISLITRQLIQLYLFNFKVRHVPGKKNIVANTLSRRPRTGKDKEEEEEVERFLDTQLAYVRLPLLVYSPREKEETTNLASAQLFTVKAKLAPIQGDSEVIPKYNQLK